MPGRVDFDNAEVSPDSAKVSCGPWSTVGQEPPSRMQIARRGTDAEQQPLGHAYESAYRHRRNVRGGHADVQKQCRGGAHPIAGSNSFARWLVPKPCSWWTMSQWCARCSPSTSHRDGFLVSRGRRWRGSRGQTRCLRSGPCAPRSDVAQQTLPSRCCAMLAAPAMCPSSC